MVYRAGALLMVVLTAGCATGGQAPPSNGSTAARAQSDPVATAGPADRQLPSALTSPVVAELPLRTVEESGGLRLARLSSVACTAEAPHDWTMQASDRSDRADLYNPDGSLYAGYGIQAVNTVLADYAAAYEPPLNDPALYSPDPATVALAYGRIISAAIGGSGDLSAEEILQPDPEYLLVAVSSPTHNGAIFFHATGYPGDGVNYAYALPMYFAFATTERWDGQGLLVARVAASIRCATEFQPPSDYFVVEAQPAGEAGDVNGDDPGYNPQLGTEPVNDPTTGENYLVDPSVNWSETGPEGPGYYVQKGANNWQKLEPGRLD
jgi:hypothetical protein